MFALVSLVTPFVKFCRNVQTTSLADPVVRRILSDIGMKTLASSRWLAKSCRHT